MITIIRSTITIKKHENKTLKIKRITKRIILIRNKDNNNTNNDTKKTKVVNDNNKTKHNDDNNHTKRTNKKDRKKHIRIIIEIGKTNIRKRK